MSIGDVAAEKEMQSVYSLGHARLCRDICVLLP